MTILHDIIKGSPRLAETTRTKYLADVDEWVTYAGPDPTAWTRARAQDFYNGLLVRGLKPQSANAMVHGIAYAAKWWAIRESRPDLNFMIVQTARSEAKASRYPLDPESALRLLQTTRGNAPIDLRDRVMIIVGLETGMRRMSLASMAFELIDRGELGYPRIKVLVKGRGKDRFSVPLSDACMTAIACWQKWCKRKTGPILMRIDRGIGKTGHLKYEATGSPISGTMIHKIVSRRARDAGIAQMYPHIFRHTYVAWRQEAGLTPYEIASITGHETPAAELGAIAEYMRIEQAGAKARLSTPAWLTEAINQLCG